MESSAAIWWSVDGHWRLGGSGGRGEGLGTRGGQRRGCREPAKEPADGGAKVVMSQCPDGVFCVVSLLTRLVSFCTSSEAMAKTTLTRKDAGTFQAKMLVPPWPACGASPTRCTVRLSDAAGAVDGLRGHEGDDGRNGVGYLRRRVASLYCLNEMIRSPHALVPRSLLWATMLRTTGEQGSAMDEGGILFCIEPDTCKSCTRAGGGDRVSEKR